MADKCSNCKFFKRNPADLKQGDCHKNPPVLTVIPMAQGPALLGNWPPVKEDGWCGEHKPALQVN